MVQVLLANNPSSEGGRDVSSDALMKLLVERCVLSLRGTVLPGCTAATATGTPRAPAPPAALLDASGMPSRVPVSVARLLLSLLQCSWDDVLARPWEVGVDWPSSTLRAPDADGNTSVPAGTLLDPWRVLEGVNDGSSAAADMLQWPRRAAKFLAAL